MTPFAVLAGLLLGALAAAADAGSRMHARRMAIQGRLDLIMIATSGQPRLGPPGSAPGLFGDLYALIQRLFAVGLSRRWGVKISPLSLFIGALLGGASAWLVLHGLLRMPAWVAIPATAAALIATPRIMLAIEQANMEKAFLERFPDAVDMVVRALRAGIPLTAAVRAVADEAPQPVNAVFGGLYAQTEIGVPLDEALAKAARWIHLPDFRFFAVAVALQYATGGNLTVTLDSLSDIVRRRRAMRMKAKAVSAEVRLSTYILAGLPFLTVGALLVLSPDYLAPLITDHRGNWILGAAIGSLTVGLGVMRGMMLSVTRA
jgi:tight adherence protein B